MDQSLQGLHAYLEASDRRRRRRDNAILTLKLGGLAAAAIFIARHGRRPA